MSADNRGPDDSRPAITAARTRAALARPASVPVLSEWTADVATGVTETAAADVANGRGVLLVHTSGTASTRLSTRYKTGTRIVGWFTALVPGVTDAVNVQGFAVLVLSRPGTDARKVHAAVGPSSAAAGLCIRTSRWTDKDNIVAALGVSKPIMMYGPIGLYIELSGGNVNAGYTLDGVNFTQTYSDTVANAFGSAGNPTRVEFGTVQVANGQVGQILMHGVDVT